MTALVSTTHAPDWVPSFETTLENAGYVDLAIAEVQAQEERAAFVTEVVGRLLDAHDRAFWGYLRRLMPWYPPFDEAFPSGSETVS